MAFPTYLPPPDNTALSLLGKYLKRSRKRTSIHEVARLARVSPNAISALEAGSSHLTAGQLRHIVTLGYKRSFVKLLSECYQTSNVDRLGRPFWRSFYYRVRLKAGFLPDEATPLLTGGIADSFIWGIPFRIIGEAPTVEQKTALEFLELAPRRKKSRAGCTAPHAHSGQEVLYVIHGTLDVFIQGRSKGHSLVRVNAGEAIHFLSGQSHYLENVGKDTSVLIFLVRVF